MALEPAVKNPDLIPLFETVKTILKKYENKFRPHRDEPGYYDLWSDKKAEFAGKMRNEVYFAGLIIQKHYVGFYFMPIYAEKELGKYFGAELLSKLKGKSCFYITKNDPTVLKQIDEALKMGYELYEKRGWV